MYVRSKRLDQRPTNSNRGTTGVAKLTIRFRRGNFVTTTTRANVWREHWTAVVILGAVIVLVYGDVVFLGYTLSPAVYAFAVLTPPFGYHGRWLLYGIEMDPVAAGQQNWPVYVLIGKMLRSGQLPLWNPYQGTGVPLAADPTWSTYFPFDLLYVIVENPYWDFVWLLKLWTAGILAYFLLRRMGLSFSSAIGGGLAYCLSGQFILSPFVNWTNVAILTPALLLVVMKCFDQPLRASIIAGGSLAFAIAILGSHLESLLVQFSYVCFFVMFDAVTRRTQRKILGMLTWVITILLGVGLAAFFLVPLQEYSGVAATAHGQSMGMIAANGGTGAANCPFHGRCSRLMYWVSLFIPYLYRLFQTYYHYAALNGRGFSFSYYPGYVGVCVMFLSLLPLYPILRRTVRLENSKYYFFFLAAAVLVLMKIFGIPPVNWIGLLPGFQYVDFLRYSGAVLAMSFAGAGAYGLELVIRRDARNLSLPVVLLMLVAILPAALLTIPNPLSSAGSHFPAIIAYLALAVYYAAISAYVAARGGADAGKTLVILLVLELVSYVPRGLTGQYEALRVSVLVGAALLLVIGMKVRDPLELIEQFRPPFKMKLYNRQAQPNSPRKSIEIVPRRSMNDIMTRRTFMAAVIIAALILQFSISAVAPNGIPQRYDPYTTPPYVKFLEANLGYQRAFSPSGIFIQDSPGVYALQNLGYYYSALAPSSFMTFVKANLDSAAGPTDFTWVRVNEIRANIAFYSLLGVRYFVTSHNYPSLSILNAISIQPQAENDYAWAQVGGSIVSSSFMTDVPFNALTLRIDTQGRIRLGDVQIVIDSMPFNMSLHRKSSIDVTSIINDAPNEFSFELVPVTKKTAFVISISQSDTRKGNEVAVLHWANIKPNPDLFLLRSSLNISLGLILSDPSLLVVYHDLNATIYENLRAFPRTFLIGNATTASDETDAILKTRELGWGTRSTAVIEGMPQIEATAVNSAAGQLGDAWIQEYSPTYVSIRLLALRSSLLVLTDTYFPCWNAYLDGVPVPTYRSFGLVRGIFIPPGSHRVIFKYEPASFKVGATISIFSGTALALIICVSVFRAKRRR